MSERICKNCEWWEPKSDQVGYCVAREVRVAAHDRCVDDFKEIEGNRSRSHKVEV